MTAHAFSREGRTQTLADSEGHSAGFLLGRPPSLRGDRHLNLAARQIGSALARRIAAGNGQSVQLSFEGIANAASIVDLGSTRIGLSELQRAGWIECARVADTCRNGKVYWAVMSTTGNGAYPFAAPEAANNGASVLSKI